MTFVVSSICQRWYWKVDASTALLKNRLDKPTKNYVLLSINSSRVAERDSPNYGQNKRKANTERSLEARINTKEGFLSRLCLLLLWLLLHGIRMCACEKFAVDFVSWPAIAIDTPNGREAMVVMVREAGYMMIAIPLLKTVSLLCFRTEVAPNNSYYSLLCFTLPPTKDWMKAMPLPLWPITILPLTRSGALCVCACVFVFVPKFEV